MNKVTLKSLATHTSGLPRLATNLSSKKNRYNPFSTYTEDDLLAFLSEADFTDQMGSFEYSNTGVGLLGYILCKVSGSTYDDLLKKYDMCLFVQANLNEDHPSASAIHAIFKFITKKDLYPLMPQDPVGIRILEATMQR